MECHAWRQGPVPVDVHQEWDALREDLSKPLVHLTHVAQGPWTKIWNSGPGKNVRIPYGLALDDTDPRAESAVEAADLHAGIQAAPTLARC
jgi:hypothetical protein